jgi:hypothetical protein
MGSDFTDSITGVKGRKLSYIAGNDNRALKQIRKNLDDPSVQWTIELKHCCFTDPINFRDDIQDRVREYIRSTIDGINWSRRAEVDAFNANLREEISEYNRSKPSTRRVFGNEKRTFTRILIRDIPISCSKTAMTFLKNDYITYEEILDVIRSPDMATLRSRSTNSPYLNMATNLCYELNQPIADLIKFCSSLPEPLTEHGMIDHPAMIRYLKVSQLEDPDVDWFALSKNSATLRFIEKKYIEIDWIGMSGNPAGLHYLEQADPDVLVWDAVSANPSAIPLLTENLDKLDWDIVSANPAAIDLLEANLDKIEWIGLSNNPAGIHLLEANPDKINWDILSGNPAAIHLLEENPDKINWSNLSSNPAAIHLLEANPGKIDWSNLSANTLAIHLLENNSDKIDWFDMSGNPAAVHLLKENPEEIEWEEFENKCFWDPYLHEYELKQMLNKN